MPRTMAATASDHVGAWTSGSESCDAGSSSVNSGGARGGPRLLHQLQTATRGAARRAPTQTLERIDAAAYSMACCRKQLMNSRSSTAMPSSDAASSGAPDDASSAESESDTDTADAAARAGGRGAGAVARGARGRRAGSSIVANDSTAGSRE